MQNYQSTLNISVYLHARNLRRHVPLKWKDVKWRIYRGLQKDVMLVKLSVKRRHNRRKLAVEIHKTSQIKVNHRCRAAKIRWSAITVSTICAFSLSIVDFPALIAYNGRAKMCTGCVKVILWRRRWEWSIADCRNATFVTAAPGTQPVHSGPPNSSATADGW